MLLVAPIVPGPVFPTARSNTGVTALIVAFVLFNRPGSNVPGLALALFVTGPEAGAVSTTSQFVPDPAGNVTTMFDSSTPPGPKSTTTTLLATEGPRFVTAITLV